MHVKPDDILPLSNVSNPEAEMLKRIMQQMVENERQRVRNEFIRIILAFSIVLLLLMSGGIWLSHDILRQIREERTHNEQISSDLAKSIPPISGVTVAEPVEEALSLPADTKVERTEPGVSLEPDTTALEPADIKETSREPEPINSMVIPIKGDIPLRAPIPKP